MSVASSIVCIALATNTGEELSASGFVGGVDEDDIDEVLMRGIAYMGEGIAGDMKLVDKVCIVEVAGTEEERGN